MSIDELAKIVPTEMVNNIHIMHFSNPPEKYPDYGFKKVFIS